MRAISTDRRTHAHSPHARHPYARHPYARHPTLASPAHVRPGTRAPVLREPDSREPVLRTPGTREPVLCEPASPITLPLGKELREPTQNKESIHRLVDGLFLPMCGRAPLYVPLFPAAVPGCQLRSLLPAAVPAAASAVSGPCIRPLSPYTVPGRQPPPPLPAVISRGCADTCPRQSSVRCWPSAPACPPCRSRRATAPCCAAPAAKPSPRR